MEHTKLRPGLWPAYLTPGMIAAVQTLTEPRWAGGDYVIYLRSHDHQGRLERVALDGGPVLQLASDPPPPSAAAYAGGLFDVSDAHVVYTLGDGGLALMPVAGGPGRRLVSIAGTRGAAPTFSPDGTQIAYVTDNGHTADIAIIGAREEAWPRRLPAEADFVIDPAWHPGGRYLAWVEWDVPHMGWDESRIVICDLSTGVRRVVVGEPGVSAIQPRWAPDGRHLAFLSDKGGYLNLWLAAEDGADPHPLVSEPAEHGTPPWASGSRTYDWAPDSRSIVYGRNSGSSWTLHVADVAARSTRPLSAPAGLYGGLRWSPDGRQVLALYTGPQTAPEVVAVDAQTGVQRVLATGAVGGIADEAVAPQALTWKAGDGMEIPGLLYLPPLSVGERAPLLVWIHGGPTGQAQAAFNPAIQYFVQRGWAVLQPNHRGSTGYGRRFTQAERGEWGRADMADILAGVTAATARGDIDPARVVPLGGSAGGYAVLQLLVRYPDRFRAGVVLFGVSDLFELARTTHRLEARYLDQLIGPLPGAYAAYRDRSPLFHLDQIRAPLLWLHGTEDPVVPPAQAQSIHDALQARGLPVELQFYEGEGHGWLRAATIRDYIARVDRFLETHVLLR